MEEKEKSLESEIESLKELIEKIDKKCYLSYIGIGIGAILALIAIIYYMLNPDIIAGSFSLLAIGVVVILLNYITLKQRRKRIEELSRDLKVSEKMLSKK
ncbi:MAG: hypothetical protein IJZ77_05290 [Bacilli bacterium]|nr:hypothetical protein [Bacilli bacterium]